MSTFREKVQAKSDWGKPDPAEDAPPRGRWNAGVKAETQPDKRAGRSRRSAKAQITGHPQFPAFAALWFAALFGLGSLAISSEVLGMLVTAVGLPALVPAAAPPLGFTAHLLVALALTVVGGVLGLVLGLRLRPETAEAFAAAEPVSSAAESDDSGVPKVRARDAHPDAPPRRPLVLTEAFADSDQLSDEEPMVPAAPLLRRKAGQAEDRVPAIEPEVRIAADTPAGTAAIEPIDLAELGLAEFDEATEPAQSATPEPQSDPEAEPEPEVASASEAEPFGEAEAEPVDAPFAAPGNQEARPTLLAATPQIPTGYTLPLPSPAQLMAGETWSPVAGAPLDSLGLVQLIERLALAIAARKAADDAGPPPPSDSVDADGDTVVEADTQTEVGDGVGVEAEVKVPQSEPSAPFAKPSNLASVRRNEPIGSAREAILRRLGGAVAHAPAAVPPVAAPQDTGPVATGPGPFSRPSKAPANVAAHSDAVVALRQPDRQPSDHAATKVTSAASEAAPSTPAALPETDEALRSALATLQRMSARA